MPEHDRYLVYRLLGRVVEMVPGPGHRRSRRISGVVNRVCRDIFEDVVEVTFGSRTHQFKEPGEMVMEDGDVVFVYGGEGYADDEEMFRQLRDRSHAGETIYDVLRRTSGTPRTSLIFRLGDRVDPLKGKEWRRRRRGAVPA